MRSDLTLRAGEQELLWFHHGTTPMMAIFPDDVDTPRLRPLAAQPGLAPLVWTVEGTVKRKSLFPDDVAGVTRNFQLAQGEQPVYWFHRGTKPMRAALNDLGEAPPAEEGYATGAVHFDGANSSVRNAALETTNSRYVAYSFWFKQATNNDGSVWAVDSEAAYLSAADFQTGDGTFRTAFSDGANALVVDSEPVDAGSWHHLVCACDTNAGIGLKPVKVYVDDADVTHVNLDVVGAFVTPFDGLSFYIGNDFYDFATVIDMADFWFAVGQNLLVGGDIPVEVRRKFIDADGKPVDLGADGSTPTGTAPAIFLRRAPAAAASTFANNLGTGGAFSITGSLTNAGTSPSD